MKKLILLLLLFPFVTFSQSVFSPKSNPNSLGIAKDFSDKNSIDKPLNYTIENSAEEELELIVDFINKENFEGALLLVNSTIKKFPDFKPAFFIRGKIRTALKYYNEAISDFKVLLNSEPSVFLEKSKSTAYMYIGLSEYYLKNYKESLINLNKSIEYESDSEMTSSVQELIRKVTSEKVASDLERYKNQTKVVPVFDKPKSNFSSSEVNSFKNKISNKSSFNSQDNIPNIKEIRKRGLDIETIKNLYGKLELKKGDGYSYQNLKNGDYNDNKYLLETYVFYASKLLSALKKPTFTDFSSEKRKEFLLYFIENYDKEKIIEWENNEWTYSKILIDNIDFWEYIVNFN